MAAEEEEKIGIPEWVVTFGDMMSLLLTFFIMLVSLSEIKEEEKYQAMVESISERFGYDLSSKSLAPGDVQPRNSQIAKVATDGRSRRLNVLQGGDKVKAPTGEHPRTRIVRPGEQTTVGTCITFDEGMAELSAQNQSHLDSAIPTIGGKPQKIEIRGHTTRRPLAKDAPFSDHWNLAYQRCWNTFQYLTNEKKIDPRRVRMSIAGANEPRNIKTDPRSQGENARVEVFLLTETVSDLMGTREEREKRYTDGDTP